jgi:hypothetical protein
MLVFWVHHSTEWQIDSSVSAEQLPSRQKQLMYCPIISFFFKYHVYDTYTETPNSQVTFMQGNHNDNCKYHTILLVNNENAIKMKVVTKVQT